MVLHRSTPHCPSCSVVTTYISAHLLGRFDVVQPLQKPLMVGACLQAKGLIDEYLWKILAFACRHPLARAWAPTVRNIFQCSGRTTDCGSLPCKRRVRLKNDCIGSSIPLQCSTLQPLNLKTKPHSLAALTDLPQIREEAFYWA